MIATACPPAAQASARWIASVVLPAPPFCCAMVTIVPGMFASSRLQSLYPRNAVQQKCQPSVTIRLAAPALDQAAALLRAGELVAFPTETVYGLGGDATSDESVAAIFAAKGRPRFNPLIVHLSRADQAERFAQIDSRARAV